MTTVRQEIKQKWKPRKASAHKGDFGRVLILAGSRGLTGAAYLTSIAALKAGAGLVTLAVPEKVYPVLARRSAEVMVRPYPCTRTGSFAFRSLGKILKFASTQDVIALGPGLSQNPETQRLVRSLILKNRLPLVIDADGLNALSGHLSALRRCEGRAVLTPHPGEFRRLFGGKLNDQPAVRRERAREAARQYKIYLILKGHQTVVASPEGRVFVNSTGNPGMASGGTGDVLTGVVAALLGQGCSFWDAARFGVYMHGLAGDLARRKVGEVSLTAGDVLEKLPAAIRRARGGR